VRAAVNDLTQRLMSLVAILAVCGIVVSSVSLQHHYATSKTAYCDIGETFNYDIVNRSEYSSSPHNSRPQRTDSPIQSR